MKRKYYPLIQGLLMGVVFGFLLQRGGVTRYNVIIGQLLLKDFTVLKIIVTAIITGMIGLYFLKDRNKIKLVPKGGTLMMAIPGGLIFGVGFALLGYCPGTIAGAVGQGSLDALLAGLVGIIVGSGLFALLEEKLRPILKLGRFKKLTLPELFDVNHWLIIIPVVTFLIFVLVLIEKLI